MHRARPPTSINQLASLTHLTGVMLPHTLKLTSSTCLAHMDCKLALISIWQVTHVVPLLRLANCSVAGCAKGSPHESADRMMEHFLVSVPTPFISLKLMPLFLRFCVKSSAIAVNLSCHCSMFMQCIVHRVSFLNALSHTIDLISMIFFCLMNNKWSCQTACIVWWNGPPQFCYPPGGGNQHNVGQWYLWCSHGRPQGVLTGCGLQLLIATNRKSHWLPWCSLKQSIYCIFTWIFWINLTPPGVLSCTLISCAFSRVSKVIKYSFEFIWKRGWFHDAGIMVYLDWVRWFSHDVSHGVPRGSGSFHPILSSLSIDFFWHPCLVFPSYMSTFC